MCKVLKLSQGTTTTTDQACMIPSLCGRDFLHLIIRAVLQFVANTDGQLTFLAFETKGASNPDASTYTTSACKFVVELKLLPNALSSVDASQLFPEANAADALPGSFLKVHAWGAVDGVDAVYSLHPH